LDGIGILNLVVWLDVSSSLEALSVM
jgi:hypothetical protein